MHEVSISKFKCKSIANSDFISFLRLCQNLEATELKTTVLKSMHS